jgi:methylated-DNA-[protein]-cysteine S-methyltransferase
LQKIPFGKVKTYGELAKILNTSARAVGNACRRNPVPLIVPCHRIVAATGIGGYAGRTSGDVHNIKRELLQHEGLATV